MLRETVVLKAKGRESALFSPTGAFALSLDIHVRASWCEKPTNLATPMMPPSISYSGPGHVPAPDFLLRAVLQGWFDAGRLDVQ